MSSAHIRVVAALRKSQSDASQPTLNTKKPVFAFIDFCNANRPIFKESNPTATWVEIQMVLENVWKGMSDIEKAVYTQPQQASQPTLKTKKPVFAFIDFCNANRPIIKESNPTATYIEINMVLENIWRGKSESEKSVYYETQQ